MFDQETKIHCSTDSWAFKTLKREIEETKGGKGQPARKLERKKENVQIKQNNKRWLREIERIDEIINIIIT